MNQPEAAQSSTQTPAARNVGSIPITRSPSQKATPAGKPGKNAVEYSECPRAQWYAPFGKSLRAQGWTLRKSGPKWTTNSALIERVTPDHDTAWESKFVLPLGVFFDATSAVLKAQDHFPQRWDGDHVGQAFSEVRVRKIGLCGGSYVVIWRGEWHYDYAAGGEWKLVEQQTGTLEKPLPITRV